MGDYDPEAGEIAHDSSAGNGSLLPEEPADEVGEVYGGESTEDNPEEVGPTINSTDYDYFIDLQSPPNVPSTIYNGFNAREIDQYPRFEPNSLHTDISGVQFYSHKPAVSVESDSFLSAESVTLKSEFQKGHRTTTTTYNPPDNNQSAYGTSYDNYYGHAVVNDFSGHSQQGFGDQAPYEEDFSPRDYHEAQFQDFNEVTNNYNSQGADQLNISTDEVYDQFEYDQQDKAYQDAYHSSYGEDNMYYNEAAAGAETGAYAPEVQYVDYYAERYYDDFSGQQEGYYEDQQLAAEHDVYQPTEEANMLDTSVEYPPSDGEYLNQRTTDDESLSNALADGEPSQQRAPIVGTRPASETEKRKHLKVWERFFENAMAHKQQLQELEEGDEEQSSHKKETSAGQHVDTNAPVAFSSLFGRKFFTSAITSPSPDPTGSGNAAQKSKMAMETGWKLLVSASRYQSLIRLANAAPKPPHRDAHKGELVRQLCLFAAVITNDATTVQGLLYDGVDVGLHDEQGRGLLHYATRFNSAAVVPILFDQGVDIDVMDKHGHTALHIAIGYNRGKVVKFLLDSAVNTDIEDIYGISARALGQALGFVDCVHLLDGGESLDSFENDGDIPEEVSGLVSPAPPPRPSTNPLDKQKDYQRGKISSKLSAKGPGKDLQPADQLLRNLKSKYGGKVQDTEDKDAVDNGNHVSAGHHNVVEGKDVAGSSDSEGVTGEEDEEEEVVEESLSELVAAKVWGMTIDLIGVTMGLLFGDKKKGRSNDEVKPEKPSFTPLLPRPPTDSELLQQGFSSEKGQNTPPPAIQPPKDVQLAIAMARAQQQQQSDGPNKYSLGTQLPPGAKWRYVAYSPESPI